MDPTPPKEPEKKLALMSLSMELGLSIALPLIILALGGRLADRHFGTSPLFLLIGIVVSIIFSTWIVWKKASKIIG